LLGRLFLAFTIIPLVEFYLLIEVGKRIGTGPTILIVLITGWAGAVLARREGWRVFTKFQSEVAAMRMPGDIILEGVLVLASGLLLITPGFLTDIFGLSLLVPPVRAKVAKRIREHYAKKMRVQQGIIDVEVIDQEPDDR